MTRSGWLDQYIVTHTQRELARGGRVLRRVEEVGKSLRDEPDARLPSDNCSSAVTTIGIPHFEA